VIRYIVCRYVLDCMLICALAKVMVLLEVVLVYGTAEPGDVLIWLA